MDIIAPLNFKITLGLIIAAYLIGSVSSAILLCKLFKLPDPRKQGSKNPGATNVLRVAGKKIAAMVLVLDVLKGFGVVSLAKSLSLPDHIIALITMAVFLGQLFPIFFEFRGGKGVAITLGAILALFWKLALLLILVWIVIFLIFRISSVAALSAVTIAIISACSLPNRDFAICIIVMSLFILTKHTQNIKNLLNKSEHIIKF